MRKIFAFLIIPVFIFINGVSAFGGERLANIIVSATMVPGCGVTTNPLAFGEITPYGGGGLVSTTIIANCSDLINYTISIDAGAHKTVDGKRAIAFDASSFVPYVIWWDAPLGDEPGDPGYGDTFTNGILKLGIGNGSDQTYTIYGTARPDLGSALLPSGTYMDILTVKINF